MRIPDVIRKCVCFVGYQNNDGRMVTCGTGFFVCKELNKNIGIVYCITAAHIIKGLALVEARSINGLRDRQCLLIRVCLVRTVGLRFD